MTGFQIARIARETPDVYEGWRLYAEEGFRPAVHGPFALEDAATAHEAVTSRGNLGKAVLVP